MPLVEISILNNHTCDSKVNPCRSLATLGFILVVIHLFDKLTLAVLGVLLQHLDRIKKINLSADPFLSYLLTSKIWHITKNY